MEMHVNSLLKRSLLLGGLLTGGLVAPMALGTPLHAFACTFTGTGSPGAQTVRPSYGDLATVTASYSESGTNCGSVYDIVINWGDGNSSPPSSPYVTSYTAQYQYSPASSKTYYLSAVYNFAGGGRVTVNNIASVSVIGCPPSCLPTR